MPRAPAIGRITVKEGVMPREQITYPEVGQRIGDNGQPAGMYESDHPLLHVAWTSSRGDVPGHVQVALQAQPPYLAQLVADISGAQSTLLHTGVLDRHAINRAIRALRRARDAAYGRDE